MLEIGFDSICKKRGFMSQENMSRLERSQSQAREAIFASYFQFDGKMPLCL
jgi:hypothetical protein